MAVYVKDPQATLDYAFDWSEWLAADEAITARTITVATGLTKTSDSENAGIVTVWLSGGTAGQTYTVACRITTDAGRTDERTLRLRVLDR